MLTFTRSQKTSVMHLGYRFRAFIAFLLGIAIPTSTALMNITLGFVVVSLLWQRDLRLVFSLVKKPIIVLPLLIFILLVISLFLTHNSDGLKMVNKYVKLLLILPLAMFFSTNANLKNRFICGFLFANFIILIISLLFGLGEITFGGFDPHNPTVFKLQITQNVFIAFAALIWLAKAVDEKGPLRWAYSLLVLLACCNVLLMVQGRTGYVALFVSFAIWLYLTFPTRQRIAILGCAVVVITLLTIIPNRAVQRLHQGMQEIQGCLLALPTDEKQACDNSMGQRTAFARESLRLIKQSPLLGNGSGSFYYSNLNTGYSINNPHNQYLLETVQNGLLGLSIFLGWMLCCLHAAWRQQWKIRNLFIALIGSYLACNLFNSFLLDISEGYFFILMVAILAASSATIEGEEQSVAQSS
ncbi:O-antigen ligase family protein [Rouxiella sp. WC2420]|uniref:O-antigen ligase family protein n=1 Tax=Rouxiella sp. WC2420 TaxID=3234145 RepID=A0AB39VYY3_9GAMM